MRLSTVLLPALLLLAGCGNGDSIGQGRLIGCYAAPGAHRRETVKLTRVDGRYFIAYRLASPWRQVATPLVTPDDEQRAVLFNADERAQMEEALLTPDGQSGVFRFKPGAHVHGEALHETHVVVEHGKVRAMRKRRCQWLFSRGTLLRYGT
ncbi:hypothetical protein ABIA71_002687 [Stenotrophomonas sp. 2619]|uniref:hypothetical protein n=1 Tax=Stenotrophomonas sp. 2619 TaxID=3156316 RepID=UPI00339131BF